MLGAPLDRESPFSVMALKQKNNRLAISLVINSNIDLTNYKLNTCF